MEREKKWIVYTIGAGGEKKGNGWKSSQAQASAQFLELVERQKTNRGVPVRAIVLVEYTRGEWPHEMSATVCNSWESF